jgi:uncharacterized membrane protein (UPF0127 family)
VTDASPRRPDALAAWVDAAGTAAGLRWLWRAVVALLVLGLLGFLVTGANGPPDPRLGAAGGAPAPSRPPIAGFGDTAFRVQHAGTATAAFCGALAETSDQHQGGMMGRRDLGGFDAMVFRFPADTQVPFYNRNVPIDLSIAWFDSGGRYVRGADMPSCPNVESCPLFSAGTSFRYALETPKGGMARLGVGPGSTIVVGGTCPS